MTGRWNGPVATTTKRASMVPSDVSTRKPAVSAFLCTNVTSTPHWIGAAIFDKSVGLSRTTGQITHETAPDVDTERGKLFDDLKLTGDLAEVVIVPGFHKVLEGRNGQGNPWHTDGDLYEGVISPGNPNFSKLQPKEAPP